MNLRTTARDEFPRGWWRSSRWWLDGLRDLALNCLTAVAAALFVREAMCLVRHRDSPRELSRRKISTEGWTAGLLVGCTVLGSMAALAAQDSASVQGVVRALAIAGILWSLTGVATSATALAVLLRSRIRHRAAWAEIDFVETHAPKHGRPPETVEEYRALRMKSES